MGFMYNGNILPLSGPPAVGERFDLVGEAIQLTVEVRTGDRGVDLRGTNRGVAEQLRDRLDGHAVREGQCRGEGVAGTVKRNALIDPAELHQLRQTTIAPAVARQGKDHALMILWRVLIQNCPCHIEQTYLHLRTGLVAHGLDPTMIAELRNMGACEALQIDKRQPREAAEEEGIPHEGEHRIQPFERHELPELLLAERGALHKLVAQPIIRKGIADRHPLLAGPADDVFQRREIDPGRIAPMARIAEQVAVKGGDEIPIEHREGQIRLGPILADKGLDVLLHTSVLVEGRGASIHPDLLFEGLVVALDELQDVLLTGRGGEEAIAHPLGRRIETPTEHRFVGGHQPQAQPIQLAVDAHHLQRAPHGSVLRHIPRLGWQRQACRELRSTPIDRDAPHDRDIATLQQRTSLEIEQDITSVFHSGNCLSDRRHCPPNTKLPKI